MLVKDRILEVLAQPGNENRLEVHNGELREKPSMTFGHGDLMFYLGLLLGGQLDRSRYRVRVNHGRLRKRDKTYYIPDVYVIPMSIITPEREASSELEIYDEPLPFVAEAWSKSTATYDSEEKLPEYMDRGDRVIWYLHPFEETVRSWVRQPDGSNVETLYQGGKVEIESLPGVIIDLDELFS